MVNKNVPSNIIGKVPMGGLWCWRRFSDLCFLHATRNQTCFQRDVRRKAFSKQVTKNGKKTLKSLTSTSSLNVTSCPYIWSDSSTMSKCPEMSDENEKKHRELNWRLFLTILETLQYLARQGLALQGENDDESNFIQLLRLQSKKFPELTDRL